MIGLCVLLLLLFALPARAYETDQLTDRHQPPPEVSDDLDRMVDGLLVQAIIATNRRTRCRASDERTRQVLAKRLHHATAAPDLLLERGLFHAFGYGRLSARMERELPGRYFPERGDIYGGLGLFESVILHVVGPCSTYRVEGVLTGSDKFHHFFSEGFKYWTRAERRGDPAAGIRWGTATERSIFGMLTSNAFSFADLKSNYDGYLFYDRLLEPGSLLQRADNGCVVQTRPWRWAEWVTWHYDEVLYPSHYTDTVQAGITERLQERRAETCASYRQWAPEGFEAVRAVHPLPSAPPWIEGRSPRQGDPFDLPGLCGPAGHR